MSLQGSADEKLSTGNSSQSEAAILCLSDMQLSLNEVKKLRLWFFPLDDESRVKQRD